MTTRAVVDLREPLTPMQTRVLALLVEAPGYKVLAQTLDISKATARIHVAAIADKLPSDFAPEAQPKERASLYAMRVWALAQQPPAPAAAAQAMARELREHAA